MTHSTRHRIDPGHTVSTQTALCCFQWSHVGSCTQGRGRTAGRKELTRTRQAWPCMGESRSLEPPKKSGASHPNRYLRNGSDGPKGTVRPRRALRRARRCRQPQRRPVVACTTLAANCGALAAPPPRWTLVRVPRRGACEARGTRVACGAQSTTVSGSSPGGPPPAPRAHGRARRCRQPKGAAVHSSRTVDADARRGVAPRRTHGRSGSD